MIVYWELLVDYQVSIEKFCWLFCNNTYIHTIDNILFYSMIIMFHIGLHTASEPIIQWGMWVGISNFELAWKVARNGGVGTLSSAALCMLPQYKHLLDQAIQEAKKIYQPIPLELRQQIFHQINLDCIKLEIQKAKQLANGKWPIFMNFLFALQWFDEQVQAACEAWVDGITSGAGIAWNLPEITKNFPHVALGIMLSDPKGVKIVVEKWKATYGRVPDYIIFEDPWTRRGAWWHLWTKTLDKIDDPKLSLENSVPAARQRLDENGYTNITLVWAGWIIDNNDVREVLWYGADMVQVGTRFLASEESWAHETFKQAVVDSTQDDIITYMSSVGLPARALKQSPILTSMQWVVAHKRNCLNNCLKYCWLRDGDQNKAQMCIINELVKSTKWSLWEGLMFVGNSAARITSILTVEEIMKVLTK